MKRDQVQEFLSSSNNWGGFMLTFCLDMELLLGASTRFPSEPSSSVERPHIAVKLSSREECSYISFASESISRFLILCREAELLHEASDII